MTDLIFRGLQDGSPDLFFGREGPPDGADAHIAIAAQLPAITASASAAVAYGAQINAVLLAPTGAVSVQYRSEVSRPTVGAAADSIKQAVPRTGRAADSATLAQGLALPHRACWQQAAGRASRVQGMWQGARRRLSVTHARFAQAVPSASALQSAYQDAREARRPLDGLFQDARAAGSELAGRFQEAFRTRRRPGTFRFQASLPESAALSLFAHVGMSAKSGIRTQFQEAMPPRRGIRSPVVIPPVGGYAPPPGDAVHLLFKTLRTGSFDLLFSDGLARPVGPVVIPVLESYFVINTVTLVRADTGEPVEAESIQVGIGRDGPHWSWSASIPGSSRHLVARNADPVELLLTLNGAAIRLVVERRRRDRSHGSDAVMVYGRSRSAWLSDPHAGVLTRYNASPMTARQLATDVLTINGVSIGWGLDWQLPDWLVPEGVWSHQGTYMDALVRLAEAGGGYLQASPSEMTMAALPHYPVAPWDWASATPDIVLPEDVVEVEGTEDADKPGYNAVYVEGQGVSGRRDRILRAGSAGDMLAPQIIDALATHVDMTRARGLAVLADSGPQSLISLRVPVLDGVGLILPGKLVEYVAEGTTRRGLTRSMSAAWSLPELWQTIEIEIHG